MLFISIYMSTWGQGYWLRKSLCLSFWLQFLEAKRDSGELRCPAATPIVGKFAKSIKVASAGNWYLILICSKIWWLEQDDSSCIIYYLIYCIIGTFYMGCKMRKHTFWHVRPTKTKISLHIHSVWSESSLSVWRNVCIPGHPNCTQWRFWSNYTNA